MTYIIEIATGIALTATAPHLRPVKQLHILANSTFGVPFKHGEVSEIILTIPDDFEIQPRQRVRLLLEVRSD